MSKDYDLTIHGHPNIYNNNSPRNLRIFFSEPDYGVNQQTGIVLLIPGFGANAGSNVYKKMRSVFADEYNLVSVQCNYFGWEFMQSHPLPESRYNFNDMGIMQALDNITAISIVGQILKDNNLNFNAGKIIAYGHSHGGYLAYLMNALSPDLFSLIIDNSAWLYPLYLEATRQLYLNDSVVNFDYIARNMVKDKEILRLEKIYLQNKNKCEIQSFHGSGDSLITIADKRSFCGKIENCTLHEVNVNDINGQIFKSIEHGLNADFLMLFDYCMKDKGLKFKSREELILRDVEIATEINLYSIKYSSNVPILSMESTS
ncbi:DUF2920 family protein [Paenibacillus sp. OK076]|uniref:DUF2920 family protein n=1 Tax=Paenibacillus sp. OK076 TaxID=1884379 RepID=UPI0008B373B0|nr:DUF2920 family protein [Paenibacillus sp. OK076]SEO66836.1 Protein of unknown function [Paenibacillus sp. OK076]